MVIRIAQGYLLVGCLLVSDLVAGQNPDVHAAAIPGKIASRVFSMPLRHCLPDRLVGLALLGEDVQTYRQKYDQCAPNPRRL